MAKKIINESVINGVISNNGVKNRRKRKRKTLKKPKKRQQQQNAGILARYREKRLAAKARRQNVGKKILLKSSRKSVLSNALEEKNENNSKIGEETCRLLKMIEMKAWRVGRSGGMAAKTEEK
jgi:dihydropteroate synthase